MRFSTVFEPRSPVRATQDEERAPQAQPPSVSAQVQPAAETPDDLDQRVRQLGEWQLEDW
jgi:hypothetical protein